MTNTNENAASGDKLSTMIWCDLKSDEDRANWLLLGRGYETGVVAHAIQNDLAMAYHRLAQLTQAPQAATTASASVQERRTGYGEGVRAAAALAEKAGDIALAERIRDLQSRAPVPSREAAPDLHAAAQEWRKAANCYGPNSESASEAWQAVERAAIAGREAATVIVHANLKSDGTDQTSALQSAVDLASLIAAKDNEISDLRAAIANKKEKSMSENNKAVPKIKTWEDRYGSDLMDMGSRPYVIAELVELRAALAQQKEKPMNENTNAALMDERQAFEQHMAKRGKAAIYEGDGLYSYKHVNDQADAFRAGVEFARAALAQRKHPTDAEIIGALWAATERDWEPSTLPTSDDNIGYIYSYRQLIAAFRSLAQYSAEPAPSAPAAGELTDEQAAEILIEMREHMLAWGEAQGDDHQVLDIEDDEEEGFPAFAGECLRFLAPKLAALATQPAAATVGGDEPKLPEPLCKLVVDDRGYWVEAANAGDAVFTADQMHQYARDYAAWANAAGQDRDAARYSWLRQFGYQAFDIIFHTDGTLKWGSDLDAAIDTAAPSQPAEPGKEGAK